MLIYFNGDSHMAGAELVSPEKQAMSARLATKLDAQWVTEALPGAGNDYIYDNSMRWLDRNNPDLVIIGWTQFNRVQWFLDGEFREINHIGSGGAIPSELQKRYERWYHNSVTDGWWDFYSRIYWHDRIFNMHKFLEYKNIPHLFFNAFDCFKFPENQQEEYFLDWGHDFIEPYNESMTFVNWAIQQGYKEVTPGFFHFGPEAHEQWTQILYEHIKNNNLL